MSNPQDERAAQFDELVSAYREAVGIPAPHTDMWLLQAAAFRAALVNQKESEKTNDQRAEAVHLHLPEGESRRSLRLVFSEREPDGLHLCVKIEEAAQPEAVPQGGQWAAGIGLAVIGHRHFGNPIPTEWYAAAKELIGHITAAPPSPQPPAAPEGVIGYTLTDHTGKVRHIGKAPPATGAHNVEPVRWPQPPAAQAYTHADVAQAHADGYALGLKQQDRPPAAQAMVPLTDEQIEDQIAKKGYRTSDAVWAFQAGVHFAEQHHAAHGIGTAKPAQPESERIERKVYRASQQEYSEYLAARFRSKEPLSRSFDWQGHRWAYLHSSFDDAGDFDLLYRWAAQPSLGAGGSGGEG